VVAYTVFVGLVIPVYCVRVIRWT